MTEWKTKTVGELADTQLGKMLNKKKQTGINSVPYLRSLNVQWGRVDTSDLNMMDILPSEREKFTVKKGDLLVCEGGESGRVAIWDRDDPIGFQNALHRVRARAEVTNKYLYYYFEWLVKNQLIEHLFNGVTIKHFPQENLRSVEVSYPAIDEQQKIVEILEDHLSRLDAALADVKQAKFKAAQFRRSLLQAAFTGNLMGDGTRLMTDLPNGWEIMRLDEIADVVMGQSPPGSSYNENGEGRPFFQGKTEFGEVHPTVRKYTTAGTKFAKAGDILMSVRAPVGPTNIADIDCVIGRGLAAIRAKTVVSQNYLRWSLKHLEIDIQSKGTGTTFDAITGETLRGTLIALPPIPEQHRIVEILEDHLSRLDASVAIADAMEKQSSSLRRSLLQAAFTGQLTKEVASV